MSPARSHVEQSRNTLLFASCAKEVTTNAQVNVVVSDKALVKQLQRELARLENELKIVRTASISFDSAALLREKDLEIEKLKKEVTILTGQIDLARSEVEVEDLREVVNDESPGDEKLVRIWEDPDPLHPILRVQNSRDYKKSITPPRALVVGLRSSPSDRQSCISEECFLQLPDFKLNTPHRSSSPQLSSRIPNFVAMNHRLEEYGDHFDENSEALCKEVRCIGSARSSMNTNSNLNLSGSSTKIYQNYNMPSPRESTAISGVTVVGDGDRLKRESMPALHFKNNSNHPDVAIPSPETTYLWRPQEEISSYRSLKLTRSRSCKASLMTGLNSEWIKRVEKDKSTPPMAIEKDFTGRPDGIRRKLSALKYGLRNEGFSRNGHQISSTSTTVCKIKTQVSRNESQSSLTSATEEISKHEQKLADQTVQVTEPVLHGKIVKDISLDPIPYHGSPTAWSLEFKRLQGEIIELWHACGVSLVHRTYFFMLFKGDRKDYIYMEVEHRRLSFLNNVFSRGNQTVENRRVLTPASSLKALRRERHMLSQQMSKRLSKAERKNLFLKWGIALNSKHRRLQLAHCLWIDNRDMDHIAESAAIVAKLVGFIDPEKTSKEMFGLNFTPGNRTNKRHYGSKCGVMSIL